MLFGDEVVGGPVFITSNNEANISEQEPKGTANSGDVNQSSQTESVGDIMELSLEQTMLIGVLKAFGVTSDLIVISTQVMSNTQIMDFLWWMEHRMQELDRYLRTEEVQSELSVRTFNLLPEDDSIQPISQQ